MPSMQESTCTTQTQHLCTAGLDAAVAAETQKHLCMKVAAPALQGDVCLFPAVLDWPRNHSLSMAFLIALLSLCCRV